MKSKLYISIEENFYNLYKTAIDAASGKSWESVQAEISEALESGNIAQIASDVGSASVDLDRSLNTLESLGVEEDTIEKAIRTAIGIGGITASGIDLDKIKKFSIEYDNASIARKNKLIKQAGIFSSIVSGIKNFGSIAYTVMTSIKSLYTLYKSFFSLKSIWSISELVGLKWFEVFIPGKLDELLTSKSITGSPENLGIVGKLCAHAINLVTNGISMLMGVLTGSGSKILKMIFSILTEKTGISDKILGGLSSLTPIILWIINLFGTSSVVSFATRAYRATLGKVLEIVNYHLAGSGGGGGIMPPATP